MDPKGIAKFGVWEENQPVQGQFRRAVTFNDGTKGYEIYQYGTDGPIQTVEDPKLGNDAKQAADYLDYQKKVTPVRTDVSSGGGVEITTSTPLDPKTGKAQIDPATGQPVEPTVTGTKTVATDPGKSITVVSGQIVEREIKSDGTPGRVIYQGPPRTTAEVAAARGEQGITEQGSQPVPDHPGIFQVSKKVTDAQGNSVSGIGYVDASGNPVDLPSKTITKQQTVNGQVWNIKFDEQGNQVGNATPAAGLPTEAGKPTLIDDPSTPGGKLSVIPDPSQPSGVRVEKVPGIAGVKPGQGPTLADLQTRYGQITDDLQTYAGKLQQALAQGVITQADYDKRIADAKSVADTKVSELNSILATQRSIYSEQAANWRQEQATANSRLNASVQNLAVGSRMAESLTGASGQGRAGALWGTLTAGRAAGEMYGGYASGPPPPLPPAAQRVAGMDINDDGSITFRPRGTPSAGAPQPQSIVQQPVQAAGTAAPTPAAMGSINDAVMADMQAARQRLPGNALPGPGMGYNGQLSSRVQLPPMTTGEPIPGGGPAPGIGLGTASNPVPMSAAMAALPPDLLQQFGPDILSQAMSEMPEYSTYG